MRGSLSLVGLLLLAAGVAPLRAQSDSALQEMRQHRRLTVRPREIATATRTERAGVHELAPLTVQSLGSAAEGPARVYVPQKCVGTQRCPLLMFVWDDWGVFTGALRPMADKYGIILLYPATLYGYYTFNDPDLFDPANADQERQHLDALLTQVLQQFAIDPDKLAIMGICKTARTPMSIAGTNARVFNRVISLSGTPDSSVIAELDPPTPGIEFFLENGIDESKTAFETAQKMQEKGYRVTRTFGLYSHGHNLDTYNHVGRWLQETWGMPAPAAWPTPSVIEPPVLTLEALTKMTAFWTRFLQEPDSVLLAGRHAHMREVVVPVGQERPLVELTDMAALAAAYPSVAAALTAAGLTAQEHDAYRVALISARVTDNFDATTTVEPTSVLAKNVAFMKAHLDEFAQLENARYLGSNSFIVYSQGTAWFLP